MVIVCGYRFTRVPEARPVGRCWIVGAGIWACRRARLAQRRHRGRGHSKERPGGRSIWTSFQWPDVPYRSWGIAGSTGRSWETPSPTWRRRRAPLATTSYDSSVAFGSDGRALSAKEQREVAAMGRRVAGRRIVQAQRADPTVSQYVRPLNQDLDWQSPHRTSAGLRASSAISTIEAEYSGLDRRHLRLLVRLRWGVRGRGRGLLEGYRWSSTHCRGVLIVTRQLQTERSLRCPD